jgi:hypothetical protein
MGMASVPSVRQVSVWLTVDVKKPTKQGSHYPTFKNVGFSDYSDRLLGLISEAFHFKFLEVEALEKGLVCGPKLITTK